MSEKCILDPGRDCYGLRKALEIETELKDHVKHNTESHERFFNRLEALEKQEGIQIVQYEHIMEKLDKLATDVAELKSKPAKRWEGIIEKIISVLVAAIVGFMLARIGL